MSPQASGGLWKFLELTPLALPQTSLGYRGHLISNFPHVMVLLIIIVIVITARTPPNLGQWKGSQPATGAQHPARKGLNRHYTFQGTRGERKIGPLK